VTPQQLQQWQQHDEGEQHEDQLALQAVDTAEADAALFSTPDTTSTHSRACYISNASGYAGRAALAGSASDSIPSQQQLQLVQPNCIEFSPIRGVALWGEEAAAAAAGMGTPGGCGSDDTAQQTPVAAGAATPGEAYSAKPAGEEYEQECCGPEFSLPLQQQCAATPCRVSPGAGCSMNSTGSPQFGWQRWQQLMQATPAASGSSSKTPSSTMQQQQQPAESSSLLEQLLDESAESLQGLMQQESSSIAASAGASLHANGTSSSTPQARQQQQAQVVDRQGYAPTVASLSWLQALQQQRPGSGTAGSPHAMPPSPAESVDSFECAAAGEPYSSACFASGGKHCSSNSGSNSKLAQHRRSQSWSAFEGLSSMLDSAGAAATPATVACKDGWGPAAAATAAATAGGGADSTSCRLFDTPAGAAAVRNGQEAAFAAAVHNSSTTVPANMRSNGQVDHADPQHGCDGEDGAESEAEGDSPGEFVLFRAGGGGSMADLGLLNPVAVQDLADRLAAAELRATQQQQEVVKVSVGRLGIVGRWLEV
jgi:hypothetical protein